MAKLRRNHERKDKSGFSTLFVRVILFFIVAIMAFIYLYRMLNTTELSSKKVERASYDQDFEMPLEESFDFIPSNSSGQIVFHDHYALSYIEEYEQAEWTAYRLTAESLRQPNVKRERRFTEDYEIKSKSARHKDYSHSGFTRGHLVPAGDMAFNRNAMKQTFFMSNMSPQIKAFNGGIWRELEETVRDWAMDNEELYVVSGPIFTSKPKEFIGQNRVAVPDSFYKVILDIEGKEKKGIAFIFPHEKSTKPLQDFAVKIDEVEKRTGLDFFAALLDQNEEELESAFSIKQWAFDKKRFKQRVNNWNNN